MKTTAINCFFYYSLGPSALWSPYDDVLMRAQVRYEDVLALIDWKIYIHYVLKYNKTLKDLTDLKWRFLSLSKPTFLSILQLIWIKFWRTNRPCETFFWIDIWRVKKITETVIDRSKFFQRRVTNRMSEQLSWTLTLRLACVRSKLMQRSTYVQIWELLFCQVSWI